jgi:DNA mismatch repair protein MutS
MGMTNIDIYTGRSTIFETENKDTHNPTTYDELERFISIYNPSEVIFISNLPDENEMDYIISYAGIQCSLIHKICTTTNNNLVKVIRVKNCEKQTYQKEILAKFYKIDDFDVFFQNDGRHAHRVWHH